MPLSATRQQRDQFARCTGGVLGQVTAGRDIRLTANSSQQFWTTSTSGAASSGSLGDQAGGLEQYHGLDFGFGFSGDIAYNSLTDSVQTFIRDSSVGARRRRDSS